MGDGSIKWSKELFENQRFHLGSYWTFFVLNDLKAPLKAYKRPEISCHKNQTLNL